MSINKDNKPTICNLCGGKVVFAKSTHYASGYAYKCTCCGAIVGTYKKDKDVAMGTLATTETRKKRWEVHKLFDRLWKTQQQRTKLYEQLASELDMEIDKCHFASMNDTELEKANEILLKWWREKYDR